MTRNVGIAFSDKSPSYTASAQSDGSVSESQSYEQLLLKRDTYPDWYRDKMDQVEELQKLADNWDSYGAKSVRYPSIECAASLLDYLAMFEGIEEPTVTASPQGNACLCWDNGKRSLDVEVFEDGSFDYVYLNANDSSQDKESNTDSPNQIARLLVAVA